MQPNPEWKTMKKLVSGLIAATLLSACAATDDQIVKAPREEKAFVTGSNIPARDKGVSNVQTVSPAELERAAGTGASAPAPGR
jgi:hypothetical protein